MSTDLRQIITDRLADLGWSVGDLVRALDGRVARTAVYEFVRGDRDIYSSGVEAILDVLECPGDPWPLSTISRRERSGKHFTNPADLRLLAGQALNDSLSRSAREAASSIIFAVADMVEQTSAGDGVELEGDWIGAWVSRYQASFEIQPDSWPGCSPPM